MTRPNPFDLSGKVALVTGANSGIGLSVARGLADAGADVVVWGRRAEANERAAAEIEQAGVRVLAQSVDVADENQVGGAMQEAVAEMGRLDCVMVNAGIATLQSSFLDMTTEAYHGLLAINQHGAYYTVREALRHMVDREDGAGGSIVICGSLSNFLGTPKLAHYAAAKGALAGIMRSVAVEYADRGIRINMVAPGRILTDLGNATPEQHEQFRKQGHVGIPAGRLGEPADMAGIVVYLASDASRYHTGDLIRIDGGLALVT